MSHPAYTAGEARARQTFLALMWALSYPGRVHMLPDGGRAFHLLGETLLDLETSFYTPDVDLIGPLSHNGARHLDPDRAAYHFYPTLTTADLLTIENASVGSMLYPDQAATLFIGCTLGTGRNFTLSGPGIRDEAALEVDDLPDGFWALRAARIRYPLGWDIFLVDGLKIIGLPRSTSIV